MAEGHPQRRRGANEPECGCSRRDEHRRYSAPPRHRGRSICTVTRGGGRGGRQPRPSTSSSSADPGRRGLLFSVPLGSRPGVRYCAGSPGVPGIAAPTRLTVHGEASTPPADHMASSNSSSPIRPVGSSHLRRRARMHRNKRWNKP